MKRIIYANENGEVSILIPTGELAIEEVARKDVPAGIDYWIVDTTSVPEDRTFRNAWEIDLEALGTPTGQGIGQTAWFAEQEALKQEAASDNNQPE